MTTPSTCWCTTCRPPDPADPSSMRLALCPSCGNKRCPRAHNHTLACTNSNAPGQPGSSWEHVRPVRELIALRPRADGNYTLPEAPVPAVPPATPKPRAPSNGCHNRAPFKASTELRDHHGRLVTSWPFRMASDCQYTLSDLGQADKACHGCRWRREPMAECTETPPSS